MLGGIILANCKLRSRSLTASEFLCLNNSLGLVMAWLLIAFGIAFWTIICYNCIKNGIKRYLQVCFNGSQSHVHVLVHLQCANTTVKYLPQGEINI